MHDFRGKPLQIIKIDNETDSSATGYRLDVEAFNFLLDNNPISIRHKPVCIVAIAGAFRRGKSFMLDFFLRYLEWHEALRDLDEDGSSDESDWLGHDNHAHLTGFSWRGGSERDTTGVFVWSKIFTIKSHLTGGQDIAVMVMDTQGAFDSSSTMRDCATIFALSAMLSSVLIYNLTSNIQEDDLQHLELFTDYGRLALADSGETPFQNLHFLVRDWSYPYDMPYGAKGGQKLVDKRLEIKDGQHDTLQNLRRHIRSCFTSIEGYLMPHPGLKVATDPQFRGALADIDATFVDQLRSYVPKLMSPDHIVPKKIGGNPLKLRDVLPSLKAYMAIFGGDAMPEPKSILQATSEVNNLTALSDARRFYTSEMDKVAGPSAGFVPKAELKAKHKAASVAAVDLFLDQPKMGGQAVADRYKTQLEDAIDQLWTKYQIQNDNRRTLRHVPTPITLIVLALVLIFFSSVTFFLNLFYISLLAGWMSTVLLGLVPVWFYLKSSDMHFAIRLIDEIAAFVWNVYIQPIIQLVLQHLCLHVFRQT